MTPHSPFEGSDWSQTMSANFLLQHNSATRSWGQEFLTHVGGGLIWFYHFLSSLQTSAMVSLKCVFIWDLYSALPPVSSRASYFIYLFIYNVLVTLLISATDAPSTTAVTLPHSQITILNQTPLGLLSAFIHHRAQLDVNSLIEPRSAAVWYRLRS